MTFFAGSRQRAALATITAVCERAAAGDLDVRVTDTESHGELAPAMHALNRLLDRTEAFIRESGAALTYAAEGRFFRSFLLRGMPGEFRRGAQVINTAREAMHQKAEMAAALEKQIAAERTAMEAKAREDRGRLADQFEQEVMGIVAAVQTAAQGLQGNATTMAGEIQAVHANAESVSTAANQSVSNAQAVAAAAEQLNASIDEIRRQAASSRTASTQVAAEAERASATVAELAQANRRIDEVIDFIRSVAFQTNLLSLNASVEAARAGEAGKGFAVVAQEVRNLAQKTAEAAKSIADQISAIQRASDNTATAIAAIGKQAETLNGQVGSIAEAVTEQADATADISSNINEAAAGIEGVSGSIHEISDAAGTAGTAAGGVSMAATALNDQAAALDAQVRGFLRHIRAM